MKYPSSSLHNSRPSPILSPISDIVAEIWLSARLKAKRKAEEEEEQQLLEEPEGLLPPQAPPEPSSGLILPEHPMSI